LRRSHQHRAVGKVPDDADLSTWWAGAARERAHAASSETTNRHLVDAIPSRVNGSANTICSRSMKGVRQLARFKHGQNQFVLVQGQVKTSTADVVQANAKALQTQVRKNANRPRGSGFINRYLLPCHLP
jgi:hypothetical protein